MRLEAATGAPAFHAPIHPFLNFDFEIGGSLTHHGDGNIGKRMRSQLGAHRIFRLDHHGMDGA